MPEATLHITESPEETNVALKGTPIAAEGSAESGAEIAGRRRSSLPLSLQAVSNEALIKIATEPNFINLMGESLWFDIACTAMERR